MRNYLLLLLLFSTGASAQWQSLGENEVETAYVDSEDIQRGEHNIVRMWGLFDLKSPRNIGDMRYLSLKIQREYACNPKDKRTRVVKRTAHADHMGNGDLIYSSNTKEKWATIKPDSVEEALWNIACEVTPK